MAVRISGPQFYAWDDDGNPLAGGKLYAYESGSSSTLKDTFTGEDGATANANPVILNAAGYASVFLDGSYNLVLHDANDAEVWSKDPVSSNFDNEWVNCEAASYVSTTSFTVTGDKTSLFTASRGIRLYDGATYVYSFIESSSYANPLTTVVIQSAVVVVGLTQACISIVSPDSFIDNASRYGTVPANLVRYGADLTGVDSSTASISDYDSDLVEFLLLSSSIPNQRKYIYDLTWTGGNGLGTLSDNEIISNVKITAQSNPGFSLDGTNSKVVNTHFKKAVSGNLSQVVSLGDGSVSPLILGNHFEDCGYQVIQASGAATYGPRIIGNISTLSNNDFVLQNNDFNDGITHSWLVLGNYCDQTDNGVGYGATESRGIGFTSCYGGIAVGNAMIACKGDAATHLENIQETVFIGNYYRDNEADILFSGASDRKLIRLSSLSGTIAISDTITDSVSGATGTILFWFPNGDIVQVISISGTFAQGNAFTTSGGASGTLGYVNAVQTHSNHIGNIYHKTNNDTTISFSAAGNNYTVRSFLIGNTWNNQGNLSGTKAMQFQRRFDMSTIMCSFTGWAAACDGGGTSANLNEFAFNRYWGNSYNVNASGVVSETTWFREKFHDGIFRVTNLQASEIKDCRFESGSIDIASTTNDNVWKNNKVDSSVTLTSLTPFDFTIWESAVYKKNGQVHSFVFEDSIADASPVKQLIATLAPLGGNVTAVITWELTSRSAGSGKQYCEVFRALIDWSPSSLPAVALDPNNFSSGTKSTGITLDIVGNNVEINADYTDTGQNSITVATINANVNGASVTPVNFLDII